MQYPSGLIPFSSHIIIFIVLICYFDCIVYFLAYLSLSLREIFIPSIFNPVHSILRKPEEVATATEEVRCLLFLHKHIYIYN